MFRVFYNQILDMWIYQHMRLYYKTNVTAAQAGGGLWQLLLRLLTVLTPRNVGTH
jgi:hypothetical protein